MASAFDLGLVSYFGVIFPVLLVFVVSYAILAKTEIFGKNRGLHALISFCLAMMLLFAPNVVKVIQVMSPWFVLISIFFILSIITFQFLGVKDADISKVVSGNWGALHWIILSIILIIMIGSIGTVYGNSLLPFTGGEVTSDTTGGDFNTDTGNFNQNVGRTLFHPKVVGLIFLMLIGAATIRMLDTA